MDDDTTRQGPRDDDPGATGPLWPLPDEESTSVLSPSAAASHGAYPTRVASDRARDWLDEPLPEQPVRARAGRPRPRRSGPAWPRIVAPIVLLAAVLAVVTLTVHSGVLGTTKTAAHHPVVAVSQTAKTKYAYYRVRKGDSMSTIASKYHITLGRLLAMNPRVSVSTIAVGQRIRVPNTR